jgi:hypothetical protein
MAFFFITAKQSITPNHLSIRARVRVKDQAGTRGKLFDPSNFAASSVAPGRRKDDRKVRESWNLRRDDHDGPWLL